MDLKLKKISILILFFFIGNICIAQNNDHWRQITKKDGLPSSKIFQIFSDSKNVLWVIHGKGASIYNGNEWIHSNDFTISGYSDLIDVFEDKSNNVWIILKKGEVYKYDRKDWTIYNKKNKLTNISKIYTTLNRKNGDVWIGGQKGKDKPSIYIYEKNKWSNYTSENGIPKYPISSLFELDTETVIGGTCRFSSETNTNFGGYDQRTANRGYDFAFKNSEWISSEASASNHGQMDHCMCYFDIFRYNENTIMGLSTSKNILFPGGIIGAIQGCHIKLIGYNKNKWNILQEVKFACILSYIYVDSKKNIWIGSDLGVYKYDGNQFNQYKKEVGLDNTSSREYVLTIFEDSKNSIWVGTTFGLFQFDGNIWKSYYGEIKSKSMTNKNQVYCIYENLDGDLLVGTDKGLFIYSY